MENVPRGSAAAADDDGLANFAPALEREIVPRLLTAHRAGPFPPEMLSRAGETLDAARVEELVRHLRGPDDGRAERWVDDLLDEGMTSEAVYMDLLAPAARALGRMWEEDTCDFVEVTLTLGRIQRVLRSLSHLFLADAAAGEPRGRVYLCGLAGEQHTLGLVMVAEFFVRAGWEVDVGQPVDGEGLLQALRAGWFDVVGFSIACDHSLPRLKREIRDARRASRNPGVRVMVGGRVFDADPALVRRVGADATASDARQAPEVAAALLRR